MVLPVNFGHSAYSATNNILKKAGANQIPYYLVVLCFLGEVPTEWTFHVWNSLALNFTKLCCPKRIYCSVFLSYPNFLPYMGPLSKTDHPSVTAFDTHGRGFWGSSLILFFQLRVSSAFNSSPFSAGSDHAPVVLYNYSETFYEWTQFIDCIIGINIMPMYGKNILPNFLPYFKTGREKREDKFSISSRTLNWVCIRAFLHFRISLHSMVFWRGSQIGSIQPVMSS